MKPHILSKATLHRPLRSLQVDFHDEDKELGPPAASDR